MIDANGPETETTKASNPKDAAATGKRVSFAVIPARVLVGPALALAEGAHKYGRHNYRVAGVRASVYYDAMLRHLYAWWEGEDIDPASNVHHLDKMIAGAFVLRDAMLGDMCTDDRPPSIEPGWVDEANADYVKLVERMRAEHGEPLEPFTRVDTPVRNTDRVPGPSWEDIAEWCHEDEVAVIATATIPMTQDESARPRHEAPAPAVQNVEIPLYSKACVGMRVRSTGSHGTGNIAGFDSEDSYMAWLISWDDRALFEGKAEWCVRDEFDLILDPDLPAPLDLA